MILGEEKFADAAPTINAVPLRGRTTGAGPGELDPSRDSPGTEMPMPNHCTNSLRNVEEGDNTRVT